MPPKRKSSEEGEHDKDEKSETKRIKSNYNTFITVVVGDTEQSFLVYEDFICSRSEFFKAALSNGWKEGDAKTVKLPEQSSGVFKAYLDCIYNPKSALLETVKMYAEDLLVAAEEQLIHAMVKLYILGDFLGDVAFRNEIIKGVVQAANDRIPIMWIGSASLLFRSTPAGCGLQRLFADVCAWVMEHPWPSERSKAEVVDAIFKCSPEMVSAMLKATLTKRYGNSCPSKWSAEKYLES